MSDLIERLEKGIAYSERFDHRLDNVEVADLCGRMREARDELSRLQSLSDQNRLTGGWRAVPEEPTQAMLDTVCTDDPNGAPFHDDTMREVYKEMIRHAPPLPLPGGEEKR